MSNKDSEGQSGVDNKKVDQQISVVVGGVDSGADVVAAGRGNDGRFLPGNRLSPGRQSITNLTLDFRKELMKKDGSKAAKVASAWLDSNDPYVQKLYFQFIVGQPKVQQESTGDGSNNIELMRSAMQAFSRLQELEQENARMKAELEKRTIVLNAI